MVLGGAHNLVALTDMCGMGDGQTVSSQQAAQMNEIIYVGHSHAHQVQSSPYGGQEAAKDACGRRVPYLVCPFCGEIPRKPIRKDKHVQLHVCAVQMGMGRERGHTQQEGQSFERTVASTPLGYLRECEPLHRWAAPGLPVNPRGQQF